MTEKPDTFFEKYAAIGVNSLVSSWSGAGMAAKGQGWGTELVSAVSGGAIFGVVDGMFNKKVTLANVALHAATSTAMSSLSYYFTRRDVEKNFVPVEQYMLDVSRARAGGENWSQKVAQEKTAPARTSVSGKRMGMKEFFTRPSTLGYVKNVVKTGLTMLAVGMLLAAAAPVLSSALLSAGMISTELATQVAATSIPWTGAFFGAFGAIQAAVSPVIAKFFEPPKPSAVALSYATETGQLIGHSPAAGQAPTTAQLSSTQFQDALAAQRAAVSSNTPQIG